MDVIKENMFFVVMGVVVLIALALFVLLVQPLKSANQNLQNEVSNLKSSLDGLLRKESTEGLPNEAAVEAGKKYRKKYDDQLGVLIDELSLMKLSTELPLLGKENRNEPGSFKTVYDKDIANIKRLVAERRIDTLPDTWSFWNWGDDVPRKPEQRELATKEFSLVSELVAIVTVPELEVMQLDRIEVNPGETRTGDYTPVRLGGAQRRIEPYFDVFPFVLELRMPFHKHELLIRELLQAKREIPVRIRKVSMMRLEDDQRVYKQIPPLYIAIRVEAWALDYNPQEKKPLTPVGGPPVFGGPPFRGGVAGQ